MAKTEQKQQEQAPTQAQTSDVVSGQEADGQRNQVRLRFDRKDMLTSYANAFRTNASAEEVIVELGLNQVTPNPAAQQGQANGEPSAEILFQIDRRLILNYYTAKRLAITLGQIVRRHEEQFGELKLNAQERAQQK